MKKILIPLLLTLFSVAAFGQAGSLSQSVYRSRVNDSTSVTTPAGYGLLYYNNQRATPAWLFSNDQGVTWQKLGSGSGGGTVTSVSGTADRITSSGGTTPVIDISATFEALLGKVANRIDQNNAPTTSAQLATTLSDESGTGTVVYTSVTDAKVDEETWATLTFASTTNLDANNRQAPLSKVTTTGDFAINMINIKDGSEGKLKIISNTASNFTLSFDTDFTNVLYVGGASLTSYIFPADIGAEYTLTYLVDGTQLSWVIGDLLNSDDVAPSAWVSGGTLSVGDNDVTVEYPFTTESADNAGIWDAGNPTRLTIPGSGNKVATVNVLLNFATNTTGTRRIRMALNGTLLGNHAMDQQTPSSGITTQVAQTFMIFCAGGDFIEVIPYQNSTGSLDATCHAKILIHNR